MESILYWVGIFLLVDLAFDVVLALVFWLRGKRPGELDGSSASRAILATSGCLTICLALIYAGLWMLSRG